MIEVKAGNARNSRVIAKFSRAPAPAHAPYLRPAGKATAPAHAPYLRPAGKATAPAHAPYLRPAGNEEIDYFGLKLIVHVLIRGFLTSIRTL